MARAYRQFAQNRGHDVHYVQAEDGDQLPDDVAGGLDRASAIARDLAAKHQADALLDLHFESGPQTPGVFAIVPDEDGLGTAISGGAPGYDTWENNPLDVKCARAIAKGISARTGLPLRTGWVIEPGVQSETQTGVAGDYRARLATFAYSVPVRDRTVRLVIEHGNLSNANDRKIIHGAQFPGQAAAGAITALESVLVAPAAPITAPACKPAYGTRRQIAPRTVTITSPTGADLRQWGDLGFPVLAHYPQGRALDVSAFVYGDEVAGESRWLVTSGPRAWRVLWSATDATAKIGDVH